MATALPDTYNRRARLTPGLLALAPVVATVAVAIPSVASWWQKVGIAIEAATFIGSSPIRQYAEDWTLDKLLKLTEDAVTLAVKEGLPVMYVTEDTTRADPDTIDHMD